MGDAHESDAKDVAQLEALLHGMTDMQDAMHTKAATSKGGLTLYMKNLKFLLTENIFGLKRFFSTIFGRACAMNQEKEFC